MSDLLAAVEALTKPNRIRIHHDDNTTTWETTPSLWDQLTTSTGWGTGDASTRRQGGRPPISTGIVDIINDITIAATETTVELIGRTRGNTPANLHVIAADLKDEDNIHWWTHHLRAWAVQAREQLGLNPPTARSARGARCPNCQQHTTYIKTAPKEYLRTPALAIIWDQPEGHDYHPDTDWRVGAVECRSCEASWRRGSDLHTLYDQMIHANQTHETLTELTTPDGVL
jgi:hypothetical protein